MSYLPYPRPTYQGQALPSCRRGLCVARAVVLRCPGVRDLRGLVVPAGSLTNEKSPVSGGL